MWTKFLISVGPCLSGDGSCCRLCTREGSWDDPEPKVRGKADLADAVTTGLLFKCGGNHDEDDEHVEGLQAPWSKVDPEQGWRRVMYVTPVVVTVLRRRWIVVKVTMKVRKTCELGLLELLSPRLIPGEDGEGLGNDEHVWKVMNTCGNLHAWPQVPILDPRSRASCKRGKIYQGS